MSQDTATESIHKMSREESNVTLKETLRPYGGLSKDVLDIILTLALLPFVLPIFLVIAFVIRVTSGSPVLIKPKRLGRNGSTFYKYKFRTMVPNAEAVLQQLLATDPKIREEYNRSYKIKNDPRITWVGHFIRRLSLDELPQFINVMRGEMSWIGPRDIIEPELVKFGSDADKLLFVKPGITGLWQVSGRSELSYEQRRALDMHYIDNLSLLQDLKILLRTLPAVLSGRGAI